MLGCLLLDLVFDLSVLRNVIDVLGLGLLLDLDGRLADIDIAPELVAEWHASSILEAPVGDSLTLTLGSLHGNLEVDTLANLNNTIDYVALGCIVQIGNMGWVVGINV